MRLPAEKVASREAFCARAAAVRERGKRVVFSNGCFDILHAGHVRYLARARAMGDALFVGVNTDRSVRGLKGPSRPLVGEAERAEVLAALESVECVTLFDEPTPLELILACRPDVLVKGGDYTRETIVGADAVEGWGGKVVSVALEPGLSTSSLVERILLGDAGGRP